MTSKLPQENSQIMFQTCVLDQKVQRKKPMLHFKKKFKCNYLEHQNIFDIIEISKFMEHNKCTH
jgi:hypothetical protein